MAKLFTMLHTVMQKLCGLLLVNSLLLQAGGNLRLDKLNFNMLCSAKNYITVLYSNLWCSNTKFRKKSLPVVFHY